MNAQTNSSFHVHDIMDMLSTLTDALSLHEMEAEIKKSFGETTLFCSCSTENMTAADSIQFLLKRRKIFESEPQKYRLVVSKSCGH